MHFAEMIRTKRQQHFPTPKDFHREKNLSCSYYHYSKIEAGTVPDVDLAVEIIRALEIPIKKGLFAYLRMIMPDNETRSIFTDLEDENAPELAGTLTIHKSLILNHSHIEMLAKNPTYLEATLLLACHARWRKYSTDEIASATSLTDSETRTMLDELERSGLVIRSSDGRYTTREWIYTPNDSAFLPLKDATIKRALERYIDRDPKEKWQRTVTRLATPEQREAIEKMLEALASTIVSLPDLPPPDAKPYTVGVFSSWRSFGNA